MKVILLFLRKASSHSMNGVNKVVYEPTIECYRMNLYFRVSNLLLNNTCGWRISAANANDFSREYRTWDFSL